MSCGHKNKRIIFVPFIHAFGGVERLILGLSRFLHDQELPHVVVCFNESIDFASFADWPMPVLELPCRRNPLCEAWALNRFLRGAAAEGALPPLLFDLKGAFYAGMFPAPEYYLHLTDPPSLLPLETSKQALSLRDHGLYCGTPAPPGIGRMLRSEIIHRINRRGAAAARSVVAMTHTIAAELRLLYGVEAEIVRPGVELLPAPARVRGGGETVRLLSVCRLEPNKRIDWIMRAVAALEFSDWVLDLVGEGSQREALQRLAAELGIADRVLFHGKVSDAVLEEAFAAADLFLMPAVQGYGLPALESLARDVPVILHRDSGVSEILTGTDWAEVIEDGPEDLAAAMKLMVHRVRQGALAAAPKPAFPSQTDWAREISTLCRWMTDQNAGKTRGA